MKLVLFLNIGGVCNLKDCGLFLENTFNDPYILGIKNVFLCSFVVLCITKAKIRTMGENYRRIDSSSSLNFVTTSFCGKLDSRQKDFQFDFVNLYVPSSAKGALQECDLKNDDELILLPLYPHRSSTTIIASLGVLYKEVKKQEIKTKLKEVEFFYKGKFYDGTLIDHVLGANESLMPGYKKSLTSSAHSLPLSVIERGDPYERHINAHFELLKEGLKDHFDRILLAYQSKLGPAKWLGPSTSEILSTLRNGALICSLSFYIDYMGTIFELGVEYGRIASKNYKVIVCPDESEELMEFILKRLHS